MTTNEDDETPKIREAAMALAEHFDTVQIFVTRYDVDKDGTTVRRQYGTGNWFARLGQVSLWVSNENERERERTRKEENEQDEE